MQDVLNKTSGFQARQPCRATFIQALFFFSTAYTNSIERSLRKKAKTILLDCLSSSVIANPADSTASYPVRAAACSCTWKEKEGEVFVHE